MLDKIKNSIKKNIKKVTTITVTTVAVISENVFATDTVDLSGLDTITSHMTSVFAAALSKGLLIVSGAVGLGLVFQVAKWLWGKLRYWLAKA